MNQKLSLATTPLGEDRNTFADLLYQMLEHADACRESFGELLKMHALGDLDIAHDIIETNPTGAENLVSRAKHWLELADEFDERLRAAESEMDGKVDNVKNSVCQIYLVPVRSDGKPNFEDAMPANYENMLEGGWLWRDNVMASIHTLTGGRGWLGLDVKKTKAEMGLAHEPVVVPV